jgi:peptidoglycan LD-endopeptidase CwlK
MGSFSTRSKKNLKGLHPDLLKVFEAAILNPPYDFAVTDGKRTVEEQKKFVATGKSKTMKSRHLSGKAVDIMAYVDGKGTWRIPIHQTLAKHILAVAKKLNILIVWGGDWNSFPDYVHFELDKTKYGY